MSDTSKKTRGQRGRKLLLRAAAVGAGAMLVGGSSSACGTAGYPDRDAGGEGADACRFCHNPDSGFVGIADSGGDVALPDGSVPPTDSGSDAMESTDTAEELDGAVVTPDGGDQ